MDQSSLLQILKVLECLKEDIEVNKANLKYHISKIEELNKQYEKNYETILSLINQFNEYLKTHF